MRKRSNVYDFRYFNTCTVDSSDSRLTSVTRSLYEYFYFSQTKIVSYFCTILSCHLGCIRSVLFRTSESHLTSRRPTDYLTFAISKRYNNVVKRRMNMSLTVSVNFYVSLLCCDCFLCHINSYYLVAFFLFATVFFLPLRVRALFFVLWPLKGKPIR